MGIKVVHVRSEPARNAYRVYVGRKFRQYDASPLGNPVKMKPGCDRAAAIEGYRLHMHNAFAAVGVGRGTPDQNAIVRMIVDLANLLYRRTDGGTRDSDMELACWCAPEACHADVIAEIVTALAGLRAKGGAE